MASGNLQQVYIESQLLRKTPLNTASLRSLVIYTPPGHQNSEKLPCVFFLPGFGSSPQQWLDKDFPMHRLMDYLILTQAIPRALLVCVDGSTPLGGSQYVDSVLNGPFSRHIIEEIVPYVEHHYGSRGPHSICGHSSGGMGALHLASCYPQTFRTVASFAGDLHFELTHKNMLADLVNDMRSGKCGLNLKDSLDRKIVHYVLALCAAYSPNLEDSHWRVDFPIDLKNAMIDELVWKKWLSFDPLHWKKSRLDSLKKCDLVYLSAGQQDQYQLHLGAEAFVHIAQERGINCRYEAFQGNHSLTLRQIEAGLKALLN